MVGSASLPGIVTYCHAAPAPHSRTAPPPIGARPLCKYCVTARAPACSRQGPITPATNPSHRLVKIVHFPSFLFPPLSLSSCFDFILFFSFSSHCVFLLSPLYSLSPYSTFLLSCLSPSPRAGNLVELCTLCTVPIHVISVLFLIHLFPLILWFLLLFYCCTCIPGALDSWSFIMGIISNVFYYTFHPDQLRSILQWLVLALDFERSCACAYG